MDSIALWFASTLGQYVSKEVVIFIISMIPILEPVSYTHLEALDGQIE